MKSFDLDCDTYKNPVEGKTYISPPIQNEYGENATIRIVTRGIEQPESYEVAKEKGEILLRTTSGGKNIITAKVFEKSNRIHVLNIQQYTAATGNPHKLGFAFIGDEITKLFNFIRDVQPCASEVNAISGSVTKTFDFFKSQSALVPLLLLSKSNPQVNSLFIVQKQSNQSRAVCQLAKCSVLICFMGDYNGYFFLAIIKRKRLHTSEKCVKWIFVCRKIY